MAKFQLDTSGVVWAPVGRPSPAQPHAHTRQHGRPFQWCTLAPFTQGYIEAMFAEISEWATRTFDEEAGTSVPLGFHHISPETLATILRDCGRHAMRYQSTTREQGEAFWWARQHPNGKVVFQ